MNTLKKIDGMQDTAELTPLAHNMVMVLINHALLAAGMKVATPIHEKYVARVEASRFTIDPDEFAFAEIEADSFFEFMKEAGLLQDYVADIREVYSAYSK